MGYLIVLLHVVLAVLSVWSVITGGNLYVG
jgi:hypothetical protein